MITRGALAHVLARATGLGLVAAAAMLLYHARHAWPPIPPQGAALAGLCLGALAVAPLTVERLARRRAPSLRRDALAALLAFVVTVVLAVPAMVQAEHARAVVEGDSAEAARLRAVRRIERMARDPMESAVVFVLVGALFAVTTFVALRPTRWRVLDVVACAAAPAGFAALASRALWPDHVHERDADIAVVLLGVAGAASPPLRALGDLVERRASGEGRA